jgi:hypothetical protein
MFLVAARLLAVLKKPRRSCRVSPLGGFMKRYFRNYNLIQGQDPHSLWYLDAKQAVLILMNDDDFIWVPFTEGDEAFYEVPEPEELKK